MTKEQLLTILNDALRIIENEPHDYETKHAGSNGICTAIRTVVIKLYNNYYDQRSISNAIIEDIYFVAVKYGAKKRIFWWSIFDYRPRIETLKKCIENVERYGSIIGTVLESTQKIFIDDL